MRNRNGGIYFDTDDIFKFNVEDLGSDDHVTIFLAVQAEDIPDIDACQMLDTNNKIVY